MKQNWRHPEQGSDEAYLGNFYETNLHICGWRTKRLGVQAYDSSGLPLSQPKHFYPLFVKHAEILAQPNGLELKARIMADGKW